MRYVTLFAALVCIYTASLVTGYPKVLGAVSDTYSTAAGQMGLRNLYCMEDDLLWQRTDDLHFASLKTLKAPVDEDGWWVKTAYIENHFVDFTNQLFYQSYSATQFGFDTKRTSPFWSGTVYIGAYYAMNTSDANLNSYSSGSISYNSATDTLSSYGGAVYASWNGTKGHHLDGIIRMSSIRNRLNYTDTAGTVQNHSYGTWDGSIGLRYYRTKIIAKDFFVEPQIGFSLGGIESYQVPGTVPYHQDAQLFCIGRIGVMAGKSYRIGAQDGLLYGRFVVKHDLAGGSNGTGTNGNVQTIVALGSGHSTSYKSTIGTSVSLGTDNTLWIELTRRFGSDLEQVWNAAGGFTVKWGGASKGERATFEKLKHDKYTVDLGVHHPQ